MAAALVAVLRDLGFLTQLSDDGQQWVCRRTSGMLTRTVYIPDDAAVPSEIVLGGFWQQAIGFEAEVEAALEESQEQFSAILGAKP